MRICFVTETYPRVTETFVYEPVEWLQQAGHHVTVVAAAREELPGGAGVGLVCRTLGPAQRRRIVARAFLERPLLTASTVAQLLRLRRRRRFSLSRAVAGTQLEEIRLADVVVAHFGESGQIWLPVAAVARRRFAVYFHGYDVGAVLARSRGFYADLFASGAALLTNSEYLKRSLVDAGASEERVAMVRLGVHPGLAGTARRPAVPPRVLTVARLIPKKGVEDSIRAFAAAHPCSGPGWSYDIVGDGPLRPDLERLVERERLTPWVRFRGFLSRRETLTALAEATLFILASKVDDSGSTEGTPVAIMEAATLGVPVVSTRHAGIPEILPPDASARGFLVPENDVPALADAVARLASSERLREEWGADCARYARANYSARAFTSSLIATLNARARIPHIALTDR